MKQRREFVVAVCGGRDYKPTRDELAELLELLVDLRATRLVHGDARGVDREVAGWVRLWGAQGLLDNGRLDEFPIVPYYVREDLDGSWPGAGQRRNWRMLRSAKPQLLVAFRGGSGTDGCKKAAKRLKVPVYEIRR